VVWGAGVNDWMMKWGSVDVCVMVSADVKTSQMVLGLHAGRKWKMVAAAWPFLAPPT